MDTTDPEIEFNSDGICNHCTRYFERAKAELFHGPEGQERLRKIVDRIKTEGAGEKYDCIIGVSGGVDSTMVAYHCKKLGLRPLAVHLDNGWNSELAVGNIEKTLSKLDIDLYTYVLDWEEFKDIQLSFLRASVPNAEIPTDHAIGALLYRVAAEKGVRFIISGSNNETESIMPTSWMYDNRDFRHLKAIHRRFGSKAIRTFPGYGLIKWAYYLGFKGVRFIKLLNFSSYNKYECIATLEKELGWTQYGGKHYESIFTRFFQGYYLPKKFNIDKRLAHLSTLICAGQITRPQALEEIKKDPYPSELFETDKRFFMKKFGLDDLGFDELMKATPHNHLDYPSNAFIFRDNLFGLREAAKKLIMNV